jgi:AbrB family looped-hinge helix DNA binding protein
MAEEVVVTRKGQTTVPIRLRKKYGISEGTRLQVEDTGAGILFPESGERPGPGRHGRQVCLSRRNEEAIGRDESRRGLKGNSFDTRFLVELFYSTNENTQSKIRAILLNSKPNILSTAALSELYKLTLEKEGKDVAEIRANTLSKDSGW